jgi:hypothetical protein
MTLDINPNLQYSLLEFVAHLTAENYDELPEDLVALDFLKADKLDFMRRSGALEPFKYVLKQAGKGGGAKGVRDRIFQDYREKYGVDATEDELRIEMRKEMKVRHEHHAAFKCLRGTPVIDCLLHFRSNKWLILLNARV